MRKLVYDCYKKDVKVATVKTLSEANQWKAEDPKHNTVKEQLVKVVLDKQTKEQIKKRKERIQKIHDIFQAKKAIN